ncbi:hypothetical protein [Hansschlegelia zhihuaiae]|uniref:Uncharacterized protein n=1 Tax=Hansschlegelia zhihuaiae TaxID=405005 RepID=A0A4Q0MR23_9HYPH|nr:hypothetical protein [Hansschlegelia zhihuaiae]RXF75679.1 hypothetical protein EK403_02240 [Hansschlegelia zhihuaiae]
MADGRFDKASSASKTGVRDGARAQFPDRGATGGWSRLWPMIGTCALVAALLTGVSALSGFGDHKADQAKALDAQIIEREKRVASLDEERKRREDALADLQRRANAKESELAETNERVAALEEKRGALQRQVAELTGPVAPSDGELAVVSNDPSAPVEDGAPQEGAQAAPADQPQDSTATVDAPPQPNPDPDRSRARVVNTAVPTPTPAPAADRRASYDETQEADRSAQASGPVRVFIHVRSSDPAARNRARAVAAELRRRGVSVAEIRGVRLPVRRDSVRFFYDADRSAVSELQRAVRDALSDGANPVAQDYRSYGAPPRPGTIELWLS